MDVFSNAIGKVCSRSTVRNYLHKIGLSWKKTKKFLAKADPTRRQQYLESLVSLYQEVVARKRTIVYIDEAHIHQDLDLGYGWAERGVPFRIPSSSPGLHAKINWYGAYDFTNGRVFAWAYERCNGENSADFLCRVANWCEGMPNVTVIWDGSPVHRAKVARAGAEESGIELIVLPPYSPDLNPIEGLWKWLREEVTQGVCHGSITELFTATMEFLKSVNADPLALVRRLWPKFDLDKEEEKLRATAQI